IEGTPILELFDGKSHQAIKAALKTCVKLGQGQSVESLEVVGIHTNGKKFDTLVDFTRVEIDGELAIEVAIRNDRGNKKVQIQNQIQAQTQFQEQIELLNQKLAASVQQLTTARNLDLHTGLVNRLHFIELLKQELSREKKQVVRALIYIKPDKFSVVADKVGVIASDGIIKGLGDMIHSMAAKDDIVARFGGTVFAVLMARSKMKDVAEWVEKLRTAIAAKIFESSGRSTSLTCSIGYIHVDEGHRNAEWLLSSIQEAHNNARHEGGNKAVAWTAPTVDAQGQVTDAEWKRRLTDALKNNRFALMYQPIASLAGDSTEVNDILVRLYGEKGDEIPTKDFMPAAERNGMMIGIDRWIMERAVKMLSERHRQGNAAHYFIRISDQSLTDKTLLPWLEKLIGAAADIPVGHLVFEVAEKSAEKYITDTRAFAEAMHRIKCGFALEHFGVGHDPLHTLALIRHVGYIKIDGVLTAALASDDRKRETVRNIVEKAKQLGIHSIAEKVEKPETMAVVYQLGIEFIQGNYVQEPEVVMADATPTAAG
ncbi:MAG: GGDEF domain-containing protein, partial [Gammaproteobacteria bacterium]|nr:GGDEF domain-containing protein [Gammaproteobacteria bacterium]